MGDRYLTDLPAVLRAAGLLVIEVGSGPGQEGDAWERRARGSGGFDSGRPNHVLVHHTASGVGSDGWPDVNYCTFGDDDAPLCNLYLARTGVVWVCAAGATNTNGSGHDPCGWTPDDSMNSHAVGIEAGNNGTGEEWPGAQLDAYVLLVRALCDAYAIPEGRVHSHFEWAPDRKTDPFGPDRYAGRAEWDMAAFREDVARSSTAPPPPPPTPEPLRRERLTDMLHIVAPGRGQTLLGPMFRHFAHDPDEGIIFDRAYGPAVALSDYDYDKLVEAVFVNDPPPGQGGPT